MKKYRNYFKSQRILLSLIFITSLLSASPFFLLPFDDPSLSYPEQLALAFTSAVINTVNNSLGSSSCIEYGKVFIKKFQQLSEWIYQQLTCSNHDRIQLPTTSDEIQLTDQFLTAALDYMKEDNSKQRFCQTLLNFIENADSMNPASSMNQPKNTARSLLCFAFSMLACAPLLTITTPYFYVVMDQAHQKVLSALSFKKESPATFLLSASIYLPFFTLVMKLGVNTMSKIFDCLSNIIDSLRNREVDLYQSLLAIPDLITFLIIATSAATVIVLTDLYREEKILSLFIEVIGFKMLANIEFWTTATVNGIGALTLLNFMKSHLGKVLVASGNALNRCCCPLLGDSFIKAGQKLKTLYEHPVKNNVKVGNVFFYALKKLSITSVSKKEIQELVALEQNDYASAIPFSIR